jgi:hypothetical protein
MLHALWVDDGCECDDDEKYDFDDTSPHILIQNDSRTRLLRSFRSEGSLIIAVSVLSIKHIPYLMN